ncbi:MAG: dicarboxylate/amino acid:cation symporter [Holosporales bacterium]|jgi:Na+/H+-dicarboxylate symporter|nr:dicarboxylate/amino acid:cation symporter [Holosporales bacterium]
MFRRFVNLPVLILTLLVLVMCFGGNIPISVKSQFLAISLLLKDLIIFVLPALIFAFVVGGVLSFKDESLKIILIVVPLVCLSNFTGFWVSYAVTAPILKTGIVAISKFDPQEMLIPAWNLKIVSIISNDKALIAGVLTGIMGNFLKLDIIRRTSEYMNIAANCILKKGICPVLPFFIIGFIMKMQHEGILGLMIREYSVILGFGWLLMYTHMFTVTFLISGRSFSAVIQKFKNMLPGILVGLCSASSAAAIPITIKGAEKNLENKNIARFIIPSTANMHLLGDCFAIPMIGLALMASFGYELPSVGQYLTFTMYGIIAKFAAAGIPGGSALVFLPIFENVFGFSAPMLTAITAIYVLFDPIATSANVFGHGMFAMLFEKVYNAISVKSS